MIWNWQQHDWPAFTWLDRLLRRAEERFLLKAGAFQGSVRHLEGQAWDQLVVEAIGEEGVTSSAIEGEVLSRDSVQNSIRRELGLAADARKVTPAERGIGELMVDVYRRWAEPLGHEELFGWHRMVTSGRTDLRDVGRYRTHAEPMQIVSGRLDEPEVHFEAPPSERMSAEMELFIDWFGRTGPSGSEPLPAVTRAGLAHLYFLSIHPLEDGNGRIARVLAEKSLAQSLGAPSLTAVAGTILHRRAEYYSALRAASRHNEVTNWLLWFAGMCLEAQERTAIQIEFLIDKAKLLRQHHGQISERQERAVLRMLREGPAGFAGGMSTSKYVAITKCSSATANRDLGELVERGVLRRTGERRGTRYHLAMAVRPLPQVVVGVDGEIQVSHPDQTPGR